MDTSEQLAKQYLRARYQNVMFEPDGNIPPDFLVDGRIAVEVRRLNENENTSGDFKGLEEFDIPLWKNIKQLLPALGPPTDNKSWCVLVRYKRPLPAWRNLRPLIAAELERFRDQSKHARASITISPNLGFVVFAAAKNYGSFFVPGGSIAEDSGGFAAAAHGAKHPAMYQSETEKDRPDALKVLRMVATPGRPYRLRSRRLRARTFS